MFQREITFLIAQASRALLFWVDEIEKRQLFRELGYTSVFAFCELELNLDPHTISEMLRTCQCLRGLLALMQASAEIAPSKLREISRVCTSETEDFWIEVARTRTCREIEKLVAVSPKGGTPPMSVVNRVSIPKMSEPPLAALPSDFPAPVALPPKPPEAPFSPDLFSLADSALPEEEKPPVREAVSLSRVSQGRDAGCSDTGPARCCDTGSGGMPRALTPGRSEAGDRPPLKVRYKFIVDLEADAWSVLEEALRLAQKQSGKRDRGYLIRHLAECFLLGARSGKEDACASAPSAPYRVVIHEAPVAGVA